jgi:ParB family chromosome partitioning protein
MKPPKSRLGRGLNALLSGDHDGAPDAPPPLAPAEEPPAMAGPFRMLSIAAIHPNPHQPRRLFNEAELEDLAASVKANGLIQPVVVREAGDEFQLIAGERRLRAAKLAGLSEIPAIVRQSDSFEQAQLALVENIHRTDLNPIERATAYESLMTQLGLTQAELATRLGEQRSSIANFLRLLALAPRVRDQIAEGSLSAGHAKLLAGVTDLDRQTALAEQCVAESLSVRALEVLLQAPQPPTQAADESQTAAPSAHLRELEANLSKQLGMRIQMRGGAKKGRGKIVIHYASLDQFDELMRRMQLEVDSAE